MRRTLLPIVLLSSALGCQGLTKKHDNPVMAAPPRRSSLDDTEVTRRLAEAETSPGKIRQASSTDEVDSNDDDIFNAKVVARVNGAPVFAGEVLERYGEYLTKAREKLPENDYHQLRESIIQRDLRSHVERKLLAERMKSSLTPDQIKQLQTHVDKAFDKEMLEKLKRDLKVSTRTELELALNERGTTLDAVRNNYASQKLAMEYVSAKIERPPAPSRVELLAYYQEHAADYEIPARVKWQQIQVSWEPPLTRNGAQEKIEQVQRELQAGTSFADVARKHSDGPTAKQGGGWDWINAGSLADTKLEKQLFSLPVGQTSDVIEGQRGFHIVRVIERQTQSRKPFEDVQAEIQQKMLMKGVGDLPKQFVDKMFAEAIIETDYSIAELPQQ